MPMLNEKARAKAIKAVGEARCKMTGGTLKFIPSDAFYADVAVDAYLAALQALENSPASLADANKNPPSCGEGA